MYSQQFLLIIFATLTVLIIIFILLREFFCWYFKINKRISILDSILQELIKINANNTIDNKTHNENTEKEESKTALASEKPIEVENDTKKKINEMVINKEKSNKIMKENISVETIGKVKKNKIIEHKKAYCPRCKSVIIAEFENNKIINGYIACDNCKYILNNEEFVSNIIP